MSWHRLRFALLLLVVAGSLRASEATAAAGPTDAGFGFTSCSGLPAQAFTVLDLPDGASIFKHFPALGITPEIMDAHGPLHDGPLVAAAFKGDICEIPAYTPLGLGPASPKYRNLLVVTTRDGDSWYFADVDFTSYVP